MTTENASETYFEGWAVLEQLGHRRTAGLVSEVKLFGGCLGRIDVPRPDGTFTTTFFGHASVYALTPTTEDVARAVAAQNQPEPVHPYELPRPSLPPPHATRPESEEYQAMMDLRAERDEDDFEDEGGDDEL